ncbi:DUF1566 domain-containing protein [Ectothiorhodospiraceae bacterium BW-2]|nr:DUF1566 domain-containing protein [Ectothiorhodospiraceae bacterium BW-2]
MWKQCVEGLSDPDCATGGAENLTWDVALQRPVTLNAGGGFAGYTDWHLPNLKELLTLVENCRINPAINETIFPNTPSAFVWSASANAYNSGNAWYVDFNYGNSDNGNRANSFGVRLFRSGQ